MVSAFSSPQASQTIINEPSSSAKKSSLVSPVIQIDDDDDSSEDVVEAPAPNATKVSTPDALVAKGKSATNVNMNSTTEAAADNESEASDAASDAASDLYVVERVADHRLKKGDWEYCVKWEGYEDRTWEPPANLVDAQQLVDEYWESLGGFQQPPSKKTSKKRQSNVSAVSQPASKKRRTTANSPDENANSVPKAPEREPTPEKWTPPISLKSWEDEECVVDTVDRNEEGILQVYLTWPKLGQKSKHDAELVYKKMPVSMCRFYESNIRFKRSDE